MCCRIGPKFDKNACVRSGSRKPRIRRSRTRGLMTIFGSAVHSCAGFDENVFHDFQLRDLGLRCRIAAPGQDNLPRHPGQAASTPLKTRFAAALSRRFCSSQGRSSQARHHVASRRGIFDFLSGLNPGDSFCKRLKSQAGNIPGGVCVAVVYRSAIAARPLPYSKSGPTFRTAGRINATARARLG